MIEVTDEMVAAYADAWRNRLFKPPQTAERPAVRAGVAAVLAIVERDYQVVPRAATSSICGWRGFATESGCIRSFGHDGGHGFADGSGEQDPVGGAT